MKITITLEDNEQNALMQIMDAALRNSGLGALEATAYFKLKIMNAVKIAEAEKLKGE